MEKRFYRNKLFWLAAIIACLIAFVVYKKSSSGIDVKIETAKRRSLEISVTATSSGTVRSDREIKISAERLGRIRKLFVVEGDAVVKGRMIAEIDPAETELNVKVSQSSLERAKAYLAQLESSLKALQEEIESSIESAGAKLKEVQSRFNNISELYQKGFVSKTEMTAVESELDVAKANHRAAISRRATIQAKHDEIRAHRAAVAEAEDTLSLAMLNHEYSFIKAPSTGVMTSMPVKEGETVMKGSLIGVLITTESLYIEAFIDEADIDRVRLDQEARISMDAYPDQTLMASVYKISPVVLGGKLETRTFEVRARLIDKGAVVKPGMSAHIDIIVDSVKDAVIVPSQAVMERDGRKFVYVLEGKKARKRFISVGLSDWTNSQVKDGIKEGEDVIITPDVEGLNDGVRVRASK